MPALPSPGIKNISLTDPRFSVTTQGNFKLADHLPLAAEGIRLTFHY